ncbi:RNA polymerase sigma factor RpoH [Thiomonas sp.]|uniref:RNA polymerase sigma factor RpoH n=1 Tax=Thiomonas sp. TaxID=2047785 RepID=UPI00260B1CDB|nr:RNA polymerase sigma factor RpoH [Thiomonas sp.]
MSQALVTANFPLPSVVGSLDAYISAVHRIPVLTAEEEQALSRDFLEEANLASAKKLVLSHLRFVVHVARGYNGYGLQLADLIQEGNIGLMKAVKRFDPDQGVRLVSFAVHWIRAEMHEFILKNWRIVKVATTKAQRKLFFNLRSLKQGLEGFHDAEIDAVASKLQVKRSDVIEMEQRMAGGDVSLQPADDAGESFSPISYLSDSRDAPEAVLEARGRERLQGAGLEHALQALDERSRRIVEQRWLAVNDDGSGGRTLHDLAAEYGVSAERIRQIEAAAMKKMRKSLAEFA